MPEAIHTRQLTIIRMMMMRIAGNGRILSLGGILAVSFCMNGEFARERRDSLVGDILSDVWAYKLEVIMPA